MSHHLIATCAFGLEAVVKRELSDLDIDSKVLQPGWVGFQGDQQTIAKTNLAIRCADRILIEIADFEAKDFDQLFETTKSLPWNQFIPAYGKFPVKGRSIKSQLSSVPACQRSVKRAIVESLKRDHQTESLPESGATYQIEIALRDDHARLTLDTTGPSLHKRGYRTRVGEAPLKETLAAALILLSVWNPSRPFLDPFCGTGTLPIEAALIARRIAPGLNRHFAAENWPEFSADIWNQTRESFRELAAENRDALQSPLLATDIDPDALSLARYHAEKAGVKDDIHFQQKAFEDLRSKKQFGCIIANPPYGERLKESDLTQFYKSIPQVLQRLPTWSHFILTAFPRFEAVIQKSATRRRKLFNGRIECLYYQYLGPRPPQAETETAESEIAESETDAQNKQPADQKSEANDGDGETTNHSRQQAESGPTISTSGKSSVLPSSRIASPVQPVFGNISAKSSEQADLFASRLKKRSRHLRRWPSKRGITCFRLYEKDIPEIPLVVDIYRSKESGQTHLHIVEYERPHQRDVGEHAAWQDLMCRTAAKTLEVDISRIHLKSKNRQRKRTQHQKQNNRRAEVVVEEDGLALIVNLSDYVDTGLFLDHRETRKIVRGLTDGKRVLNLFGYTGAFTLFAAAGGAVSTLHVDMSPTYVEWARRNMKLNGFESELYSYKTCDANTFLNELPENPLFDLAVVDPPTFSNSKKTDTIWEVQKDHVALLENVAKRMATGGLVFFSTNFRRFQLNTEGLSFFHEIREISQQTLPEDFRNQRIHRCWQMKVGP